MRICTILSYASDPLAAADEAALLERAGIDEIWVPEAYGFDAVSLLGFLAARTERVTLGAGILPLFTRTPALLAMTAAGLDAVSGGRFILGLGASGPQVIEGWHGVPFDHPLERTREIIDICQKVWRKERLVHDGRFYTLPLPEEQGTGMGKPLKLITDPLRPRIPIALAALGPRNVELAAEVADAWLTLLFVPEKAADVWGEALGSGRGRRHLELAPLDIIAGGLLAIGDDVGGLVELARPFVALYAGGMGAPGKNFYNDLLRRYGYEAGALAIQEAYLAGRREEAAALVPDELLALTNLVGPRSWVKERIAALAGAGVTTLSVTPLADTPSDRAKLIEQVRDLLP